MNEYKIYCDESCHLEHDKSDVMALGYIKVNSNQIEYLKLEISRLKKEYKTFSEIKWSNVSHSRLPLYYSLIDLFFISDMTFRGILVRYKSRLNHVIYNKSDHNIYYNKLLFYLLKSNSNLQTDHIEFYIDVKDTRGKERLMELESVLNSYYKGKSPFKHFQNIHSNESIFMQIADLFVGAITYKSRDMQNKANSSKTKLEIINYIESKSGYTLNEGTEPWEPKFNIFRHSPRIE